MRHSERTANEKQANDQYLKKNIKFIQGLQKYLLANSKKYFCKNKVIILRTHIKHTHTLSLSLSLSLSLPLSLSNTHPYATGFETKRVQKVWEYTHPNASKVKNDDVLLHLTKLIIIIAD